MFYPYKHNNDKIFEELKSEGDLFRFLHRILIIFVRVYRFSEDYSQIVASTSIDMYESIIYNQLNFFTELSGSIVNIFDNENL
jgi:hypothetical protein